MDVIASFNDNAVYKVLVPTMDAFMPLLEKKRSEIESNPSRTFRYGKTDRHQVDVYYPDPKTVSAGSLPVLIFSYGGGWVAGDRKMDPPYDLAYSNLGAFFAQRGILTVIPDYRLVPNVKFPQPVEDVRDAIAWFLANTSTIAAAGQLSPDVKLDSIVVMGHSAGSNYISTLYLSPTLLPLDSPVRAATRAVIPQGGAQKFDLNMEDSPPSVLIQLYGSEAETLENMPFALLARAPDEVVQSLPEVLLMASEREPKAIRQYIDEFHKALEGRLGKSVELQIMKGHNHVSPHWALLSGEGAEWGEILAKWIKSRY